jgi:hypothetical protein
MKVTVEKTYKIELSDSEAELLCRALNDVLGLKMWVDVQPLWDLRAALVR